MSLLQKPALSSLEVRNYKIYQKTAIELRETGEGEESSTLFSFVNKLHVTSCSIDSYRISNVSIKKLNCCCSKECGISESGFYEDLLIFKGFTLDGINTKPVREIVKSTIEGQIKAQN